MGNNKTGLILTAVSMQLKKIFYYSHFLTSISFPFLGFRAEHIPWYILRVNKYRVSMIAAIMVVTIMISAAIIFKWSSPMANHYWDFIYRPILGSGNDTFIPRNIFKYMVYFLAIIFPFYYNSYDIEMIRNVAKKMFYFFCFIAVIRINLGRNYARSPTHDWRVFVYL